MDSLAVICESALESAMQDRGSNRDKKVAGVPNCATVAIGEDEGPLVSRFC